jgi:hypothetical protein
MPLTSRSYAALAVVCFAMLAPCAHADSGGIQMLPPVTFDGLDKTPCSGANAGLLYWDGATAIKCIPGTAGDGNGNVTVQKGNIVILATATMGDNCTVVGAVAQDGTGKLLSCQLPSGSTQGKWQSAFGGTCAAYTTNSNATYPGMIVLPNAVNQYFINIYTLITVPSGTTISSIPPSCGTRQPSITICDNGEWATYTTSAPVNYGNCTGNGNGGP